MKSFIDDLPVTKSFDDLIFNKDKDIVVDFQVPPNLDKIEIVVTADITNITKKVCEKKTHQKTFYLENGQYSTTIFKPYLRKYDGEYYLHLLGKAGEPIPDAEISQLTLFPLVTDKKNYYDEFSTDKEGKVKLGNLKEIVKIFVNGSKNGKTFSKTWGLPFADESFHMPGQMDYLEGEEIILPYPHEMFNSGCISLLKFSQDEGVIKN